MTERQLIVVRGASEHNLKHLSVDIPKQQITVFTGVSGSGKSSLVFDTIAAEAQRQLNETFTFFVQGFLPSFSQPDVEQIENLNAPIIIDQKRVGGGSRSTVGTYTDIAAVLRLLFSRVAQPQIGAAYLFSFNTPQGMCPECEGIGTTVQLDRHKLLDTSKSLNQGAIQHPDFKVGNWLWKTYALADMFDADLPIDQYPAETLKIFLDGYEEEHRVSMGEISIKFEGLIERFTRSYIKKDVATMSKRNRESFETFTNSQTCPLCHGARLSQEALAATINGNNIAHLSGLEVTELVEIVRQIDDPIGAKIAEKLAERLQHLVDIGLGYLSLDRPTGTLSGGESQRVKMVRHLGNSLTEMLYILDEPSVGLHARDVARLTTLLQKLRDKGNTVLVVEHDPDVMAVADYIIDIGPKAGIHGGEVVFQGTFEQLQHANTLTGKALHQHLPIKQKVRSATGLLPIKNAQVHNLKNVSINIPTGVLTVVTGVAGSGKSSLINDVFLQQYPDAISIDQARIGANSRSAPATYTGIMDDIRKLFAKTNNVSPSLFSFNSAGSCETCNGLGLIYTDLAFMEGMATTCEVCEGKRFKAEVLEYYVRDKTISDVLDMSVDEAVIFFSEAKIKKVIQAMQDVGLGYLTLGQPLSTLSGGEAQRLKLATELHKKGSIYVMDEPTTGLHLSDISLLLKLIERLVDAKNTVIIIEHHLDVIRQADWIIDLGPEGGAAGGQVLFEGPPQALKNCEQSITGQYL